MGFDSRGSPKRASKSQKRQRTSAEAEVVVAPISLEAVPADPRPLETGSGFESFIDVAASFFDGGMLVIGWALDPDRPIQAVNLLVDGQRHSLAGRFHRYARPDVTRHFGARDGQYGFCFFVDIGVPGSQGIGAQLEFVFADGESLPGPGFHSLLPSPGILDLIEKHWSAVREVLAGELFNLPAGTFQYLLQVFPQIAAEGGSGVAEFALDKALAIGPAGVLASGWLFTRDVDVRALYLVSAEHGRGAEILRRATRTRRPDIVEAFASQGAVDGLHGLLSYAAFDPPLPRIPETFTAYAVLGSGAIRRLNEVPVTRATADLKATCVSMMSLLPEAEDRQIEVLARHIGPAIAQALEAAQSSEPAVRDRCFGPAPDEPWASVIVPFRGPLELLQTQLALLAGDPDLREVELIYVLDEATKMAATLAALRHAQPLLSLSLRVLCSDVALGYAEAVNLAAAKARGRSLLLMDADVLPREHGWLSRLRSIQQRLAAQGPVGLISPRMLYEDGTLRHAASRLRASDRFDGWLVDECPMRGLPAAMDPLTQATPVQLASLSCALIDRELFLRAGGVPRDFLGGGFADLALCTRLRALGAQHYYAPELALDHPERRPKLRFADVRDYWRGRFDLYNGWRFNQLHAALTATGAARLHPAKVS